MPLVTNESRSESSLETWHVRFLHVLSSALLDRRRRRRKEGRRKRSGGHIPSHEAVAWLTPKLRIYIWGPSIFSIHSLSCSVLHRNTPPLGHPTSCFMPGCVGRKNKWWLMFDQVAQIKGVGRVLSSIQHGGHASQVHTQDVFGKYTNSLHYLTLHTFKWRRFKSIYALTLSLWRKWKL